MQELVDKGLIAKIFKLDLPIKLICDSKTVYPMLIRNKRQNDSYVMAIELGGRDIRKYKKTEIELKGRVDIEYLKYRGEVKLTPITGEPGYYVMEDIKLYKYNERTYKRVPYKRLIQITEPNNMEATLINFSASGALIHSKESIVENTFKFSIVLNKKNISIEATIIEQKYDEQLENFVTRCHFENVDEKTKKLLMLTVKEIVMQAKRRLRES